MLHKTRTFPFTICLNRFVPMFGIISMYSTLAALSLKSLKQNEMLERNGLKIAYPANICLFKMNNRKTGKKV